MQVRISPQAFSPWQELADYQRQLQAGSYGATAAFVGTMRDYNQSESVLSMTLEHYAGMTENELRKLAGDAMEEYRLLDVLIIHRVGTIYPDDPIVLVCAWSAHRREALVACREMMEFLKSRAPFWKKEQTVDGARWVEKNT